MIFFNFALRTFASPQMPDYIIYKNDTIPTYNLILEQYLQKVNPSEEKLFGLSFRGASSTNCWRGYQAIYEITDNKLYLTNIISCGELRNNSKINFTESQNRMKEIFGDKVENYKVFIDWFSNEINFPQKVNNNKEIRWDGVFYRIFQFETLLRFNKGILVNQKAISNYARVPNGINRMDKSKISDILFKQLNKQKWKNDCSEKFIVTIGENGKITNVKTTYTEKEIAEFFEKEEYNYCINEVKNRLKKMQFDIIKNKGKPFSEDIYIEIWQEKDGTLKNWTR